MPSINGPARPGTARPRLGPGTGRAPGRAIDGIDINPTLMDVKPTLIYVNPTLKYLETKNRAKLLVNQASNNRHATTMLNWTQITNILSHLDTIWMLVPI